MRNKEILKLLAGFRRFRTKYYSNEKSLYTKLAAGQAPKTLMIACSDSRVDPAIITAASPGEIFVVRNVANLVPPYETQGRYHGVSAAIEFAVVNLQVENIIVLGHRQCGGIRALMSESIGSTTSFISQWVQIAISAKEKILKEKSAADFEEQCRHCEMESIAVSLENLKTFPFVQEALMAQKLELHGAYFDLESGEMLDYDHQQKAFRTIELAEPKRSDSGSGHEL